MFHSQSATRHELVAKDLEETSERNATLLALNKRLISEMKDARAASAKSEQVRRELERQKLAAESSVRTQRQAADVLTKNLEQKTKTLELASKKLAAKESALAKATQELSRADAEVTAQKKTNEALKAVNRADAADHVTAAKKAKADFDLAQKSKNELETRLNSVVSKLDAERQRLKGARDEVKALERDLKRAAEELRDSCAK